MKFLSKYFGKLTDLQKRILFTLGALVIYRVGSFIPLPGVNASVVVDWLKGTSGGDANGLMDMVDMFSGGSLSRMSVLALNIFPYISASIVLQLLTATSKSLNDLRKEGESGRIKINQYTRYLAVLLAVIQGWAVVRGLEVMAPNGVHAVVNPGFMFELSAIVALVGGTVFVMWLAEQITARGVGQGASLLIFAGIVAQIPEGMRRLFTLDLSPAMIALIIGLVVGIVALIAFFELAQRRIQILYPRQVMANGVVNTSASYLPIKVNMSGVMGPVFASSIMMLPAFVQNIVKSDNLTVQSIMGFFSYGTWSYIIMYTVLIAFFAYFQTAVVFNSEETSNNLRNAGGYIPGVRPGEQTVSFLDSVVSKVTAIGVLYLLAVCVVPIILNSKFGLQLTIGGTSVLIVAGVVLDTMNQIQSYLVAKQYHGAMGMNARKGRFRN